MTYKKKIAVIGLKGLPAFGGGANVGENLIAQLKEYYDFTVLSISSHTHLKTGYYNGVKQVVFKSFLGKGGMNTAYYYFVSLLYVMFHKFDVAHLHHAASGFIAPILKFKCKTVLTVHGLKYGRDKKFNKLLESLSLFSQNIGFKMVDKIVSVSLHDKEVIESRCNREVVYIPNGIDGVVLKHKVNEDSYILFSAGRIYDLKGLHLLIDASKKLKLRIKIKIVGDLDRVKEYKKRILESISGLNVEMLGLIKDKKELMEIVNNAKLFVFPSLSEAMSMMLLEVVSTKTPIIASDIPANTAIFSQDELLFFKSGDVDDLSKKLEYALSNMEEMKHRAEKASIKLIENYTWDKISKQYQEIYNKL
ncbi:MAG: glycosyltransferase family 4 protein [Bacteroidales bacterium]